LDIDIWGQNPLRIRNLIYGTIFSCFALNNVQDEIAQQSTSIISRYSAMEHLVPEQMFSTDTAPAQGVSAIKTISLAVEGQRIYTIDAGNVEQALATVDICTDNLILSIHQP